MATYESGESNLKEGEPPENEDELRKMKEKYLFLTESDFDEWWSTLDSRRVEKKSYTDHEDDIFKYSVIMKAFRNEYETDSLFSRKAAKLIEEGIIDFSKSRKSRPLQKTSIEVLVPGYNPHSFIPNTSSFSYPEMKQCWEIIDAGGPKNQEQANFWASCQVKLDEEQREYMELAKEHWMAENIKRHSEIKPQIKELVDQFWKVRLERVYTYPKFYAIIEDIALTQTSFEEVQVNFIKKLETIGRPAKFFIPNLWLFTVNINKVIDKIEMPTVKENTCYKEIHSALINKGYHSDVSKDKIAENLARENGANIVMSSSGFACLLDHCNVENNTSWHLPFTVIEYQKDSGSRRIVLIDKKLPPSAMTIVSRNKYYAKLALKKLFTKPPTDYRTAASSIYDADTVAEFGVDTQVPSLKKQKKKKCLYCLQKEKIKAADNSATSLSSEIKEDCQMDGSSDSDDSSRFYIDTDDEGVELEKSQGIKLAEQEQKQGKEEGEENEEKSKVTGELSDKSENDHICCCTYKWFEVKEEESAGRIKKKKLNYQVMYNLWEFNSSASQNYMSKNCSKNLKVIIRTTAEGLVKERNENNLDSVQTQYKLSPKLEYQTEFGAEAASFGELLKEWASVYIRPSAKLARVRLDGVTGELIQIQKLSASDLAAETQRLYKVNLKDRLASVHSILVKLSDLPAGNYMLYYKNNLENFVKITKSVERGGNQVSNMHLLYNRVDPTVLAPQRSPFPPLDPTIITPTCQQFKRVPCTFAPKYFKGRKSLLQDNSAINPPISLSSKKSCKKRKKSKKQ